jgi:hypothetical protein
VSKYYCNSCKQVFNSPTECANHTCKNPKPVWNTYTRPFKCVKVKQK